MGSHYLWSLHDNHFLGKFELLQAKWWPLHFLPNFHFPRRQNRRWLWAGARAGQHPEEQYDKQYPSRGAQHRDPPLSVRNKTFRRPPTNKPPPLPPVTWDEERRGEAGDHLLLFNFEHRLYFKMAPCRDCINFKIHSNPTSWRKRQV